MKNRIRQLVREEIARMKGNRVRVNESKLLTEGTRAQVGYIDPAGNIISAYVHHDGYPENMISGLKTHFKSVKDVGKLIKNGGAKGIYDDKPIEYYKASTKPIVGTVDDIGEYINVVDGSWGEFIYLYNMRNRKWYYVDVNSGDRQLKKLF